MKKIYPLMLLCFTVSLIKAQWTAKTSVNTPVANKNASDIQVGNTNDGRTWIAFYSQRGNNYDMRAQLLDADGNRMFGDSGVLVSSKKSGSATFVFNVCVDNNNNFIVAFQLQKSSGYECVIQKINPSGKLLWSKAGVDLGPGLSPYPAVLSTNEIAVAWNDNNGKIDYQKISAAGIAAWASPKIFTGNSTHTVSRAQVAGGTNGKFNMVYQDQVSFPFYTNLSEQKFDNDGNALWASAVKISTITTASYRYYDVHIENDTTYVGYYGNPSGSNRFDAFVQRINPDGSLPWGTNGSAFSDFSGNEPYEQTIYMAKKTGANDVWAVCTVTNSLQTASAVFAQKFDALSGSRYLGNNALQLTPLSPRLISLAFSRLSLCNDEPIFLFTDNTNKLAAMKLNADGSYAWANQFSLVGSSSNTKFRYGFTDVYKGQAVAVWQEDKGNGNAPYAQNIRCNGETGLQKGIANNDLGSTNTLSIRNVYPNPVQSNLTVTITSSGQTNVHIYITDISGNILKQAQQSLQKGDNLIQLNAGDIKPGNYFIKVMNETGSAATIFNKQ